MDADEPLPLTAGFWQQMKATLIRNILRKKRNKKHTLRVKYWYIQFIHDCYFKELFGPIYFLAIIIILKLVLKNPHFDPVLDPPGPVNVVNPSATEQGQNISVAPDNEETRKLVKDAVNTFQLNKLSINYLQVSI